MRTLCLLRHAKAAQPLADQDDFDRKLTDRGRADAALIAEVLDGFGPELALVSTAARTRESWDIISKELVRPVQLQLDPTLYLCPHRALAAKLRDTSDKVHCVVLVGHNPGLHDLCLWLAGTTASSAATDELKRKFPTSALAIYGIDAANWAGLAPETSTLTGFATPSTGLIR